MVISIYSWITGICGIIVIIYLIVGLRKIKVLRDQPLDNLQPPLAIIIPVRNEEQDLEKALQSVCNLNYNNYRIIAVNDRSTDRTSEILDRLQKQYTKLAVTNIETLPEGWLGKNNALYQGYLSCSEEWLLFTDADVEFHPDAVNKAMGYTLKNNLDNLAVLPQVVSRSEALNSVLATFGFMLMVYLRPWDAIKPGKWAHFGVGAFCLVKRAAYEQAGTHSAIRLRPDEDVMLGHKIKQAGLRQDVLSGTGAITFEWYQNLQQFIDGLMKNTFATAQYNVVLALAYIFGCLLFLTLPTLVMLIWGDVFIRWLAVAGLVTQVVYMILVRNKWWYAFVIPFAGLLMAYIFTRSMILTLKKGGIYWRGTFYSLNELKDGS